MELSDNKGLRKANCQKVKQGKAICLEDQVREGYLIDTNEKSYNIHIESYSKLYALTWNFCMKAFPLY